MRKLAVLVAVVALVVAGAAYAAPRATGIVKLSDKNMALELTFVSGETRVVNSKGVALPEGTYSPKSFTLMTLAKSGRVWKLECLKTLGGLSSFTVTKGETTVLDVGPPLAVKAYIYQTQMTDKGKVVPIGLVIQGKTGEVYSSAVYMDKLKVPPPTFRILDENSKVLAEGKFEYG